MKKYTYSLLLILLILCCCIAVVYFCKPHKHKDEILNTQKRTRALVLVAESNEYLDPVIIQNLQQYKNDIIPYLAIIFNTSQEELAAINVTEILDQYGEPFIIDQINNYASSYYDHVEVLTDNTATFDNFVNTLKNLQSQYFEIDILLDLHGSTNSIWFYQETIEAQQLFNALKPLDLSINFVYQTVCYGESLIDDWKKIGAKNVNGSIGINYYTIISPVRFMEYYTKGYSFEDAVQSARIDEISFYQQIGIQIFPNMDDLDALSKMKVLDMQN